MEARLVMLAGPLEGAEFPLTAEESDIGRERSNAVHVDDGSLSRRHCAIRMEEAGYVIQDLGSSNGTFVNNLPVKRQPLQHGDVIKAGHSLFLFVVEDAGAPGPAQLDDSALVTGRTVLLDREDALFLKPGGVAAALPAGRVARDLELLLRVSTAIPSLRGVEEIEQRLLEVLFEATPAERGAVLLCGGGEGEFASVCCRGRSGQVQASDGISRSIVDRVLRDGGGLLSNDVLSPSLRPTESIIRSKVAALLVVPLMVQDRRLGAIYLDASRDGVRFEQDDLELVTGIAGVATVALENARHLEGVVAENRRLRAEIAVEHSMVGESAPMRRVHEFIAKAAPTAATVLIHGESGTGKELVARAIHSNSPRRDGPFVAINCAAITETLLESELFGHERGAFTGAVALKKGRLEEAQGGSVFLDEVGELAPALQAKLLRVLQEREFVRVGGTRSIKADIRLIAATNRDLAEASRCGQFRQDLYYRLNVVWVKMPPLRERREDIPLLANYFAQKHGRSLGRKIAGFSEAARSCLENYDWPGNVRELENVIERAVVLGSSDTILPEDLPDTVLDAARSTAGGGSCSELHSSVREAKARLILKTLEQTAYNYTEAAKLLGIHPSNLHRLIRTLNLKDVIGRGG